MRTEEEEWRSEGKVRGGRKGGGGVKVVRIEREAGDKVGGTSEKRKKHVASRSA